MTADQHSTRVTRAITVQLAELARSLEDAGHAADEVAGFMIWRVFTMFADAVGLAAERQHGLPRVDLELSRDQIVRLSNVASADWRDVEPAIFGTLLERALDERERHALGAHFTPRCFVERVVRVAIIEPLREDWQAALAASAALVAKGQPERARARVREYHARLCETTVLDPACGGGNFLYIALEHMQRLEAEVLEHLDTPPGVSVGPHQCFGIERDPRAAAIAKVVLWIGYLQCQRRLHPAAALPEPAARAFDTIECADALQVAWPEVDFIVGNPPFLGKLHMKSLLGEAYVEALRGRHAELPDSADYVMYWWDRAARALRSGRTRRFGLVTTSGIVQAFNRRVVESALASEPPLRLVFAIPNHPWIEDGADVRVAVTVAEVGTGEGRLAEVVAEEAGAVTLAERVGRIAANLRVGVDVLEARRLRSNLRLSSNGVMLGNRGFLLEPGEILEAPPGVVVPIVNGSDLVKLERPRGLRVIDLHGFGVERARREAPAAYARLLERVKPERDANKRRSRREKWWLFAEVMPQLREMIAGLPRFIVTPETNRHRVFRFLPAGILPEHKLVVIASSDAYVLGVLSSRVHVLWSEAQGGRRGVGNDPTYAKTRCFETFPFPDPSAAARERIAELAEAIEAHRDRVREDHPELTISAMASALAKLRTGELKTNARLSILHDLHLQLDAAVLDAYAWPQRADGQELLGLLLRLNQTRRDEEQAGRVKWLRPRDQALDSDLSPAAPRCSRTRA